MYLGMRYTCTQLRTTMNICEYSTRFPNCRFVLGVGAYATNQTILLEISILLGHQ